MRIAIKSGCLFSHTVHIVGRRYPGSCEISYRDWGYSRAARMAAGFRVMIPTILGPRRIKGGSHIASFEPAFAAPNWVWRGKVQGFRVCLDTTT